MDLSTLAPSAGLTVDLSTSSSGGGFSLSLGEHFTPTLQLNVSGNSSSSPSFYYEDTVAGSPTITASASEWSSGTLTPSVAPGPLYSITVSPSTATVAAGGKQLFTAAGKDAYGNAVSVSPSWTTSGSIGNVSPSSGSSTTLTAASSSVSGYVIATQGSVSNSASVTVTSQAAMKVTLTAGRVSASRRHYTVPLTVAATNASSSAAVSGASVTLQVYEGSSCSGTVTASGSGTTGSNGQLTMDFTTGTATTWCTLATVTATGYSQGSGQTTFTT